MADIDFSLARWLNKAMQLVDQKNKITLTELKKMAEKMFGNFVKAVVDVEKEIMAVDADLHADQEQFLLDQGSKQSFLWGINIRPDLPKSGWIEFDSMINLRPSQGNRSRFVDDQKIQKRIIEIVDKLIANGTHSQAAR